jgi:hypothetical protein
MNDLLLVFGGNTHKDTAMSHGAKCFSADFMAYDIECGGEFGDQSDAKWIVIRRLLRGHNDMPCGWPTHGRLGVGYP